MQGWVTSKTTSTEYLLCTTGVTWRGSPDCSPQTVALLGGSSLSAPGEESLDKVQIILCGQIPKHVGARHSGIVSLSESYFPHVGGIPDLRILHPDFIDFFFFFLIETTQLMIKNNTSRASKLWKALGQNLTSITIGQAPTAITVFCCQAGPQAPRDQLSIGLWSVETEQMCLPANALWDGATLCSYWNQMPSHQSCPANRWWLHASAITLEKYRSHGSIASPLCKTTLLPTGQDETPPFSITHSEGPGLCHNEVLLETKLVWKFEYQRQFLVSMMSTWCTQNVDISYLWVVGLE